MVQGLLSFRRCSTGFSFSLGLGESAMSRVGNKAQPCSRYSHEKTFTSTRQLLPHYEPERLHFSGAKNRTYIYIYICMYGCVFICVYMHRYTDIDIDLYIFPYIPMYPHIYPPRIPTIPSYDSCAPLLRGNPKTAP